MHRFTRFRCVDVEIRSILAGITIALVLGLLPVRATADVPVGAATTNATTHRPVDGEVALVLESWRRDLITVGYGINSNFADLQAPDSTLLQLFPFPAAWPANSAALRHAEQYAEGTAASDTLPNGLATKGVFYRTRFAEDLLLPASSSCLFFAGVGSKAAIVTDSDAYIYVHGAMTGLINIQGGGILDITGDMTGRVRAAYNGFVIIHGNMMGRLDLGYSGTAYLLNGVTGNLKMPYGGRVYIAGMMPIENLKQIQGENYKIYLEASDLAPGVYHQGASEIHVLGGSGTRQAL